MLHSPIVIRTLKLREGHRQLVGRLLYYLFLYDDNQRKKATRTHEWGWEGWGGEIILAEFKKKMSGNRVKKKNKMLQACLKRLLG